MGWEEVTIGFDSRVPYAEVPLRWDRERRDSFLLRPEALPLSVDEAVWPRRQSRLGEEGGEVLTPAYSSLEDALQRTPPDEVVVAITQWRGPGEPELAAGPTWPMVPDTGWRRLGWDVVDNVFPSGLSNCMYAAEVVLDWREWAARLNEHHLFDELPDAFAFRDATNRRVPEHAPFAVMGLYEVRGSR
ncbi:MAG: hypothetical protein KC621_22005 [Myxococcales bacterium]|nr:hypothetical protein [Myxococcales bacterium]